MKVLFICDNFPPESNAPANRTFEHCREWVRAGAEVTVITCQPNFPKGELFPGYKNRLYQVEQMEGIKVLRVWSYITSNRGTIRRSLDYLSFCLSAFIAALFQKTDIIVATSPQLFSVVSGFLSSWVKRKPWIMEVRDLWPESIRAVNASNNRRILRNLAKLVLFLYKRATKIVVVTESFKERISSLGIAGEKIEIIKNGVLLGRYFEASPDLVLQQKLGLQSKFVVGYIGTHGLAHGLEMVLEAASRSKDDQIHFLMIGEGAVKNRLLRLCESLGLNNVTMLDGVGRDQVADYIHLLDVAVVPLIKKKTFKTVLPSKIFENAACGKPILLGVEGEAKNLIESYGAGLCFEPQNAEDFLTKLLTLKNDKDLYLRCRDGAKKLAESHDRKHLAAAMLQVLVSVVKVDFTPQTYQTPVSKFKT